MPVLRRISSCLLLLLAALALVAPRLHAETNQKIYLVPDRYVLVVLSGAQDDYDLSPEKWGPVVEKLRKDNNVPQAQIMVYQAGKKPGDGLMGLIGVSGKEAPVILVPKDAEQSQMLEKVVGCDISVVDLWTAYQDNEVVADDDFKGKPVVFTAKVPAVSKDVRGMPYILFPADKVGVFGVQVFFKKDDPILRQIKKGSTIVVRAVPRGMVVKNVLADGTAILVP